MKRQRKQVRQKRLKAQDLSHPLSLSTLQPLGIPPPWRPKIIKKKKNSNSSSPSRTTWMRGAVKFSGRVDALSPFFLKQNQPARFRCGSASDSELRIIKYGLCRLY
ncbi:MAG TPA: hypothetical protein VK872_11015, partial [Draconibacterium sp.]|nr:hypothetical protein [Draconibacterium sp.]